MTRLVILGLAVAVTVPAVAHAEQCIDHRTFNYGRANITQDAGMLNVELSATVLLRDVGRPDIASIIAPHTLKMSLPVATCQFGTTDPRLVQCYASPVPFQIIQLGGNTHSFNAEWVYFSVQRVTRQTAVGTTDGYEVEYRLGGDPNTPSQSQSGTGLIEFAPTECQ
jgi:hypothetical protein